MRGLSVPLLVGLVLLATPMAGAALDYTVVRRTSKFVPIDPDASGVTIYDLSGSVASVNRVMMPFSFVFFGEVFNQVNISKYGYVTFSSRPGHDELTNSSYAWAGTSSNQFPLPSATAPNGLIAAWWDYFNGCPSGSIKTQEAVIQGNRTFTVEWNGCYVGATTNTVQMQIRFTEGSPVIRVYYGQIGTGTGTHTATVGIENPAAWRQNTSTGDWTLLTAGGTEAVVPELEPICDGACAAGNWPTNWMIQYGRPNSPDLQAGLDDDSTASGLEITGLSGLGTVTIELRNIIENGGRETASGVTWDYYLSTDDVLDPSEDKLLVDCRHSTPETIPGATVVPFTDTCTAQLDPGFYRICTFLDPVTLLEPEGVIAEAIEGNNTYCSGTFSVGADLLGSLTMPDSAASDGTLDVTVQVRNRGSDPAFDVKVQVWLRDCEASNANKDLLGWETRLSVASSETAERLAMVPLRSDSAASYCAVLVIDPENDVPEQDDDNNEYSSCVSNGDLPKQCTVVARPDLRIGRPAVALPDGCFLGEPINISAELCNASSVEARGFGVAFFIDDNTIINFLDTRIVSIPESCGSDVECVGVGRGEPSCVEGTCHVPCEFDTDCGAGGLQCETDVAISGKSCQLVIGGDSCRTVGATAILPTFDTSSGTDFPDADLIFSVIADWTEKVAEISEEPDNWATTEKFRCWTRNPDFEATEIRTLDEIASGEVVPVYRRVNNRGSVGGAFGYHYVLSTNEAISSSDLSLEIVDAVDEVPIERWSGVTATDFVRLPAGIVPGVYYLGIILDPERKVRELDEGNNASRTRVTVVGASLRIVNSSLPNATVGASYAVQLLAAGNHGDLGWSRTEGALPPGVELRADGLLHGTPSEVGTYLFRVMVISGRYTASRYVALDVLEARGPLVITSSELPPAFQNVEYRATLSASGGAPPYEWACDQPAWLSLQDNLLHGTSASIADPVSFACAVKDANGTTISQEYRLAVYPASGVRIRSQEIIGDVGSEMARCLTAQGGSGRYDWSFEPSSAPPGIGFEERDNEGCFSGVPKDCGTHLVGVTVTDEESGLSDTRRISLTFYCGNLRLTTLSLPAAERGAAYEARIEASSESPVVFELASGGFPPGLALSPEGTISGVVTVDAASGAYAVAVRIRDEAGQSGVGAFSIAVAGDGEPRVTVTNTKTLTGCSSSGQGSAAGLLPFAAFAFLGLLRLRNSLRLAMIAGLAAALLTPAMAVAQTTPGYATYHYPKDYEPLDDDAQVVKLTAANSAVEITLDGWKAPFFGELYESVWVHENGLILFSPPNNNANGGACPIPGTRSSTPLRNFVTAWWDNHDTFIEGTSIHYKIQGIPPNREVVFEWIWKSAEQNDGDDGGEHQVSIFEDGTIAFRWGEFVYSGKSTSTHRAVMGLMDRLATARSVPFHECSVYNGSVDPICNQSVWFAELRNTEAVFTILPNLQIRAASTNVEGGAGLDQAFSARVYNGGPFSTPVQVRFYLSVDENVSADDVAVGTSAPVEVGAFAEQVIDFETALPRDLAAGKYFVIAVADPDEAVKEFVETDNVGPAFAVRVLDPLPDLTVVRVGAPVSGEPGSTISIDLIVKNQGNLAGTDFPYAVVLSENSVLTVSDQVLYEGKLTVGAFQTLERRVTVTIPSGIPPGTYHLGVVLDPEGDVPESDKLNNNGEAERPFVVDLSGLTVRTVAPQVAQVGAVFCISLVAEGGDGVYTWNIVDGTLPPGLDLIPGAGDADAALCGRPTAVGVYHFVLEVESGDLAARTEMTLQVNTAPLRFEIASRDLPVARFLNAYETGLVAFGGTPPYVWTLAGGGLPAGLSFGDDGLIFGTPLEADTFSLDVSVADSAGRTDTKTVALLVTPPSRVTCATQTLGTIALGETFTGKLLAAGGPGVHEWIARSVRRIGDSDALPIDASAPPGLLLSTDGTITGSPKEVGDYIWELEVTSRDDGNSDACPVTVAVVGGQGLTVVTTDLPNAVPEREYGVRLRAINGTANLTWALAAGANLPEGLSLDSTGLLSGKPTLAALAGETSRTFGFLVEVRDDRNRKGTGLLSLTVAPEAEGVIDVVNKTVDEGCQAAGGGFSLAALGLVIAALRRRR